MNRQHLLAFFWLRWRLAINQLKRGGIANTIVLFLVAGVIVLGAGLLFFVLFLAGLFGLQEASPSAVLYVWDGLVVAFLFSWTIGLLTELQRSEALMLEKFLHLPVSPAGVFLLNYLSSLLSVNLLLFMPAMVGLTIGLTFSRGPAMLLVLPCLAAFLLMVTGITYQFQGWLASLMVNPRRRRTIIVVVTAVFILLAQAPNLINIAQPWKKSGRVPSDTMLAESAWYINVLLPPGWLPLGAKGMAEDNALPLLLATLGMGLLGTASLWRAYRTTLRLYTGQLTSSAKKPARAAAPTGGAKRLPRLMEKRLPWVSEHAAAIAVAGLRLLLRAPEAKMMLLGPVILVLVFAGLIVGQSMEIPVGLRPLTACGAMAMALLNTVQLIANQFGFDRAGFRVFILCPAQRRDILLGKNLAFAPAALCLGALLTAVVAVAYPMRVEHLLSTLPQLISMYLSFCMLANCLSILAPMNIPPGALRPTNTRFIPVLLQMFLGLLFPVLVGITLIPLGVEAVLEAVGWAYGLPICLVLSVLECAAIIVIYGQVLTWQGWLLQSREQRILEIVTTKSA